MQGRRDPCVGVTRINYKFKGHVFVNLEGSTPQALSGLIRSWRRVARRPAGRALTQHSPGSPVPPHIPRAENGTSPGVMSLIHLLIMSCG